jgi:hypothetical protein
MIKNFNDIPLKEKLDNSLFRNGLMKTMLSGIVDDNLKLKFEVELNHIIDNKRELFNNNLIIGNFYEDDDKLEDLILPSIRRSWSMIFINPPTLFNRISNDKRFELFKLLWDVDEFIDYLLDILPKVKFSLKEFENIDRTAQTLELISQNYINGLIEKCRNKTENELKIQIRDLKIKKTLK